MNTFVHRMMGHYLMDEAEEGADLGAISEAEPEEEGEESSEEEDEPEEAPKEDDGDIIVTLGDEPVSEPDPEEKGAPQWVRQLRKDHKDAQRRIKELESKLAKPEEKVPAIEVGPKPSLSDDDVDYDEEKYAAKYDAWVVRKQQADQVVANKKRQEEEAATAWQATLDGYNTQKSKLKLPDYDDAESVISDTMDVTQQGIILSGADNPALVVYALGKNPEKVKELAAIKDPVKFAFAIAKLETQVKTKPKSKPAPESTVSGSGSKSSATGGTLEKLREEAMRTGDFSKVMEFKRQQKLKEKA